MAGATHPDHLPLGTIVLLRALGRPSPVRAKIVGYNPHESPAWCEVALRFDDPDFEGADTWFRKAVRVIYHRSFVECLAGVVELAA